MRIDKRQSKRTLLAIAALICVHLRSIESYAEDERNIHG